MLGFQQKTLRFRSFCNRYPSGHAVVVASGPTKFDYKDLAKFKGSPIVFINDAVRFESFSLGDSYLVTGDAKPYARLVKKSIFFYPLKYIREQLNGERFPIPPGEPWVLNGDERLAWDYFSHPIVNTEAPCVFHNVITSVSRKDWEANKSVEETGVPNWAFDKNELTKRRSLFGHTGSITQAIHLLWYMGVKTVTMIGCRPLHRDDHRHDPRIYAYNHRRTSWILKAVISNQIETLKVFGIEPHYYMNYDD
jgi:hypothetical protein